MFVWKSTRLAFFETFSLSLIPFRVKSRADFIFTIDSLQRSHALFLQNPRFDSTENSPFIVHYIDLTCFLWLKSHASIIVAPLVDEESVKGKLISLSVFPKCLYLARPPSVFNFAGQTHIFSFASALFGIFVVDRKVTLIFRHRSGLFLSFCSFCSMCFRRSRWY